MPLAMAVRFRRDHFLQLGWRARKLHRDGGGELAHRTETVVASVVAWRGAAKRSAAHEPTAAFPLCSTSHGRRCTAVAGRVRFKLPTIIDGVAIVVTGTAETLRSSGAAAPCGQRLRCLVAVGDRLQSACTVLSRCRFSTHPKTLQSSRCYEVHLAIREVVSMTRARPRRSLPFVMGARV